MSVSYTHINLEAGPAGLEFLAFGPHHGSDGEQVDDPWIEGPAR